MPQRQNRYDDEDQEMLEPQCQCRRTIESAALSGTSILDKGQHGNVLHYGYGYHDEEVHAVGIKNPAFLPVGMLRLNGTKNHWPVRDRCNRSVLSIPYDHEGTASTKDSGVEIPEKS